ncbi:MAG: TonB-dependent receptor, partial [Pseudomonadota bacterium]
LTSITAYREFDVLRDQDVDFSGIDRSFRDDFETGLNDFTQEIRAQGTLFDDKLDWLVGLFYLNEELTLTDTVQFGEDASAFQDSLFAGLGGFEFFDTFGPAVPEFGSLLIAPVPGNPFFNPDLAAAAAADPALLSLLTSPLPGNPAGSGQQADDYVIDTNAIAVFTHNVFDITEQLSLTLGLRYNYENKDISANLDAVTPACDFFQDPNTAILSNIIVGALPDAFLLACNPAVNTEFNGEFDGERNDSQLTGTAKLSFQATDELLIYGGYDRGFKSGGFNLDRGSFDTVLLGGDGPQIEDLEFEEETVNSLEVGLKFSPSRAFTFNLSGFYQDFTDFQQLVFISPNFVTINVPETISAGFELDSTIIPTDDLMIQLGFAFVEAEVTPDESLDGTPIEVLQGEQLPQIPLFTLSGNLTYTPPLTDTLDLLFNINARYQSETETATGTFGITEAQNPGFGVINVRAGIGTNDGRFRLEGFVENLTGTDFLLGSFPAPELGTLVGYPNLPRLYGVTARVGF